MKRILYIPHRIPYPPNKGDKIRSFNILEYLAGRHELHLATLVDDPADLAAVGDLRSHVASLAYARIDQPARRLFAARNLLRRRPVSIAYFYSRSLQGRIDELIADMEFDAVLCSSSPTAEYLFRSRHRAGRLTRVNRIMDLIDVDSLKWQQYADRSDGVRAWVHGQEARSLRHYERTIYDYFSALLLVSSSEKALFPDGDDADKLMVVENGVDLDFFSPLRGEAGERRPGPPTLVFTGMMDYWPNVEGMGWFVQDVLPEVVKIVPDVRVLIVGGRPGRDVLSWGDDPRITVTGFVDDVRDYVGTADVCIAPLRLARGIQNKVLEAMAMARPMVATPQALEGIDAVAGEHVRPAEDAKAFAAGIIELLRDRQRAEAMGVQARRFVEQNYAWHRKLGALDHLLSMGTGCGSGKR